MNPQADRFPSVTVCASRDELGRNAADQAAKALRSALELRGRARLVALRNRLSYVLSRAGLGIL